MLATHSPFYVNGQLRWELRRIFELLEIELPHNPSLAELVKATEPWNSATYGPHGKPRWMMDEVQGTSQALWSLFEALGFINPWTPELGDYDHAVLMGGTVVPERRRLADLAKWYQAGVRFGSLEILGSDRPLVVNGPDSLAKLVDPDLEAALPIHRAWVEPTEMPAFESEMLRLVWQQADLPAGLAEITPSFMHATNPIVGKYAGSDEQLAEWLTRVPNPGNVLLVSSQPHNAFQGEIARRMLLGTGATIDVVGYTGNLGPGTAIYILGGISRWLLRLQERLDAESIRG